MFETNLHDECFLPFGGDGVKCMEAEPSKGLSSFCFDVTDILELHEEVRLWKSSSASQIVIFLGRRSPMFW